VDSTISQQHLHLVKFHANCVLVPAGATVTGSALVVGAAVAVVKYFNPLCVELCVQQPLQQGSFPNTSISKKNYLELEAGRLPIDSSNNHETGSACP
jgi:hypothetical protein